MSWWRRTVEFALPERLGLPFRRVAAASWLSNLGDGIVLAAGPLLLASLTDDARLVALGATLIWLPPLLFGLVAGVLSDRVSRRKVLLVGYAVRLLVLGTLVTALTTGGVTVELVLVVLFLLGAAEVFVDNTTSTLTPMLVPRAELSTATHRIMTGFLTMNELVGRPVGAALFTLGWAWPFGTQVLLVLLSLGLLASLRLPPVERPEVPRRPHLDLVEAFRWVRSHAAIRTLFLTSFTFNITFGATWSVLVLYATQRLGLDAFGFGLITTATGLGGLLGTALHGALTRRISLAGLMRIGLVLETLVHLVLAWTTQWWIALPVFFLFGAHSFVWGTTSSTIRQRAVPRHLQGRLSSFNTLSLFGGLVIGSAWAGPVAQHWGVATVLCVAGAVSAVFVLLIWPSLRHIAVEDNRPDEGG